MPKVVDHEAYRVELLRASFEVVAEIGYGSLSMKQLAKSLKISTGLIYHYFKNKEDWFISMVVLFSKETFERLGKQIDPTASLDEKTRRLAEEVARHRDHYANMISVASDFSRIRKDDKQDGMLQMSIALNHTYRYVAMLFETNEESARALVSYIAGVILASRLDPGGIDVDECRRFIRRLLDSPETSAQGAVS